jgi:hypothetical protein
MPQGVVVNPEVVDVDQQQGQRQGLVEAAATGLDSGAGLGGSLTQPLRQEGLHQTSCRTNWRIIAIACCCSGIGSEIMR